MAAGAALAAGQLPTALAGEQTSLITAVGDELIDRYAASLKDLAIQLFGTNDKAALIVGIIAVSLLLGGALGVLATRRRWIGDAGFVIFGLVGAGAGSASTGGPRSLLVVSAVLAVVTGVVVLRGLLRLTDAGARPTTARAPARAEDPRVRTPDRRAFLAWSGGMALGAAALGAGAQALRGRSSIESARQAVTLPRPVSATPVPASAAPAGAGQLTGLTPYVVPTSDFYRIDTALTTPQVDPDSWTLRVGGHVDDGYQLGYQELLDLPMVEEPVTLSCVSNEVGGDLVGNAVWLGVPLTTILERAGVRPEGTQVIGRSVDGFTAGFPTELALDGRVALVAVGMNGEPLPAAHGFPARLVVSGLYGYVSATKWLTEIELTRLEDVDGYWIPRGWSKDGPVKVQSRIDVPRSGDALSVGRVPVAGVAWAPDRGIRRVEVRIDEGRWLEADLGDAASDATWVQWLLDWDATPGRHRIEVRATDGDGVTQTSQRTDPAPDGATGFHRRIVDVAG